ncbi:TrbC/VirB2 family protein [Duganella sp. HH105]|uniref:TrbC/VirB2 family protein n=1 Tax=Duganella sp. HH105 TaxID=1781067 RepID=UPI000877C7AB|nr:TrbC/VirB2 family protein [Duganella sp. HH105]OEZ54873.1 type IV secretion system protein virB2 precursor [Duganella sp. HH105]
MKPDRRHNRNVARHRSVLTGALLCCLSLPAHAQLSKFGSTLNAIQVALIGVSVTLFTITIIVAGCQVAWRHAKITEVSHILWGGCLVGGAAGIAALLVGS